MVEVLRPPRGGFLRPFGCGWFIREFLMGNGPMGSPRIDPDVGAPQTDIHRCYKEALHRAYAEDMVAWEEGERIRKKLTPDRIKQKLELICQSIGITPDPKHIQFIVEKAGGNMRSAENTLEQVCQIKDRSL